MNFVISDRSVKLRHKENKPANYTYVLKSKLAYMRKGVVRLWHMRDWKL